MQIKYGTDGEKRALDYLAEQMKSFGFDVTVQPFDVFETSLSSISKYGYFDFSQHDREPIAKDHNLIAALNDDENKKTIIFSVYYDTTTDSIGALDNSSGTSALLEAAKLIRGQPHHGLF